jgi:hypothetical protein
MTCATCPFWQRYVDTDLRIVGDDEPAEPCGECRKYPPRWEYPGGDEGFDPCAFPVTGANCWCGAHPERKVDS